MFEGLFQPTHLIIILLIALVVFGPSKVSEIGGSLGKAVRGFKKTMNDLTDGERSNNLRDEARNERKGPSSQL
jgi:sec-independent protein translocase protein TatA